MTVFTDLLADPFAEKRYLAVLTPYDKTIASTTVKYVSDGAFVTGGSDSPAHTYFEPVLVNAFVFERQLFQRGAIGGRSVPGFGTLDLNNADGALDAWVDYAWDGRTMQVYLGGPDFAYSDFGLIFSGTVESIEYTDDILRLRLRDLQEKLNRQIGSTTYAGSGGSEGTDAVKGVPKPIMYGQVFQAEPVLVDPANLLYQLHDGKIDGVDAVYDKGVALAVTTGTPGAGMYSVNASAGTVTLGASPAGIITVDARGDATSSYVNTVGTITKRIVINHANFTYPGDFDTAAFSTIEVTNAAPVGIYVRQPKTILSTLDDLINSIGGFYGFNRAGAIDIGRIEAPAVSAVAAYTDADIIDLERTATQIPTKEWRVGYKRYWRPLRANDIAQASTTVSAAQDLERAFRIEVFTIASTATAHLLSGVQERDTLLVSANAASTEAARLGALYKDTRDAFKVRLKTQPFVLELGNTVKITYPRHGLSGGKNLVIVGMSEDSSVNEVVLDLWG